MPCTRLKKYKGDIKAAIHEIASGLHGVGTIDKQTMRHFDDSCLTPILEFSAREIRALWSGSSKRTNKR